MSLLVSGVCGFKGSWGVKAKLGTNRFTGPGCGQSHATQAGGQTHPLLGRPSDSEEEYNQRGGQQLPDKQNHPEHDITTVSQ